jgi:signal transduction histidine kinase
MESGSMTLDLKPLSPYALIDTALERLQVSAQSLRVTIEQHLTAHVPLIEADEDKLSRVLQNLLDNAIKFSPNGGAITIGVDFCDQRHALPQTTPIHSSIDPGSWVVFWIQDRGRGIPAAYHQRIFEKFGQDRDQKVRGTGLGLAFCKLTVEAHGGHIWVESEEDQGSVFAFALPLQPPTR